MPIGPQGAIRNDKERDAIVAGLPIPKFAFAQNACVGSGKGKIALLYKNYEKVTGSELKPRTQAIGDCVSFAYATAIDILSCNEIVLGDREQWLSEIASEPIYALSRVEIGRGQLGNSDGSVGSWAVKALRTYGALRRHRYGNYDLTTYSGSRAKDWGYRGLPDDLEDDAKEHPVNTSSLITSYEDARDAINNGYPGVVCSNQGFSDRRDSEGFARPQGSWAHAMAIIGVDDSYKRPGCLIMNSWGLWNSGPKRHGQPDGSFWVDADVIDKMLRQWGDSYAISGFEGFKLQSFDWTSVWR